MEKTKTKTGPNPFEYLKKEMLDAIEKNRDETGICESIGGKLQPDTEETIIKALMKGEDQREIIKFLLQRSENFPNFVAYVFIAAATQAKIEAEMSLPESLLGLLAVVTK